VHTQQEDHFAENYSSMRLTRISRSLAATNPHTKFLFHTVREFHHFSGRILILRRKIARCARGCPQAHSPVNASHDANFWDFRRSSWSDRLFASQVCQEDHWVPKLIRSKHLAFWYFTHFPLYLKPAYGASHSAINIMATFVHNEPTSLTIIQEIGLPEAFYKVVESGVEPSFEVIQAIPNALGALCLNQTGQDQLAARPSIIPGLLSIFTSERHLRVLQDKENAVLIGTSIDELIRHHPFLKTAVFEGVRSILGQIEDLGKAFVVPEDIRHFYQLIPDPEVPLPAQDEAGVAMDVDQSPALNPCHLFGGSQTPRVKNQRRKARLKRTPRATTTKSWHSLMSLEGYIFFRRFRNCILTHLSFWKGYSSTPYTARISL
jgi:hypothetical protein